MGNEFCWDVAVVDIIIAVLAVFEGAGRNTPLCQIHIKTDNDFEWTIINVSAADKRTAL